MLKKISVIVEFVAGRVQDMLLKMIALYRPDCELTFLPFSPPQSSLPVKKPYRKRSFPRKGPSSFRLSTPLTPSHGSRIRTRLTEALIVGTKGTRSKLQTWGKVLGGQCLKATKPRGNRSSQHREWAPCPGSQSLILPYQSS